MTIETELPAVKVRVLPLKWSDDPVPEAESEVGRYSIYIFYAHVELGIDAGSMSISRDRIQLAKGATLDDLKAAAQADYDRRIISALTLKDDPGNGDQNRRIAELVKALEQAKKRMRNCRGAIESNQVIDKDVHGSLTNGMADIDAAIRALIPREG